MKALDKLNNVERARLLFQLFPEEMPGLVDYIYKQTSAVVKDPEPTKKDWNKSYFMTVELWIDITGEINRKINRYGTKVLSKSSLVFAEQLFSGYLAMVTSTLLSDYTGDKPGKFRRIAELLFT